MRTDALEALDQANYSSEAATEAQATALDAQTLASAALPLSGGTMTGDIVSGKLATNRIKMYPSDSGLAMIIQKTGFTEKPKALNLYGSSPGEAGFQIDTIGSATTDSGLRLGGISSPVNNFDAANKSYVDSKAGGTIEYKYVESVFGNTASITFDNPHNRIIVRVVGGYKPMDSFVWPINSPTTIVIGNSNAAVSCTFVNVSGPTNLNQSGSYWVTNSSAILISRFDFSSSVTFDGSKTVTVNSNSGSLVIGFDVLGI